MARSYDLTMRGMERACLARWRSELVGTVGGRVLEIGSGTGANFPYYSGAVSELVLTEPDRFMRERLRVAVGAGPRYPVEIDACAAEAIPYPDASFDFVVCTLVLCSVRSPAEVLREVHRLLRPGGRLVFLEHVAAHGQPRLHRWQRRVQPVWKRVCGNCHLTRDTGRSILEAGFEFGRLDRGRMAGAPAIVAPMIKGVAVRPGGTGNPCG